MGLGNGRCWTSGNSIRRASARTQSNLIIVRELIQAIEEDRPVRACSNGEDGRAALEMIMAVHESQRLGTRVSSAAGESGESV